MAEKTVVKKGLGCLGVVGVVFVVLKLLSIEPVASWSWVWVLCPFWIGLAFDVLIALLAVIMVCLVGRRNR
jgi:hypothetical protein